VLQRPQVSKDKPSSLLGLVISDKGKKFYNIDRWSILSVSLFPAAVDAIFQSTFLFALLLFWLCIFHGLRQTDRGLYRFYLPKLLLVGTMWFSAMTMAILVSVSKTVFSSSSLTARQSKLVCLCLARFILWPVL
jgi:Wnt-binding factor required for Wnt secretion